MVSEASLYDLTNSIQPLRRVWFQAAAHVFMGSGVSASLGMVVLHASRLGSNAHQKMLAHETGINASALVRILDAAEAADLLTRISTDADKRIRLVALLPKGKALADEIERRLADLRTDLLADIDEAEIISASRILRLLEARTTEWLKSDRASAV